MLVSPSSGSLPAAAGSTQSLRTWTALAQSSSSRLKHSTSVAEDFCSKERTQPSEWGSVTWSSSFSPEWSLILFSRPAGLLQLHCSTLTDGPSSSPVLPVELLRKYSRKDNKIMATDLRKLYFLKSTQHFLSLSKSFQAKKQKHTKEQTWGTQRNKNGFLLSLSFLSTSFKCLSISLPLFLSSSHSLSEEVTVHGGGGGGGGGRVWQQHPPPPVWPQSGTHAAFAPTCCSSPADDKHNALFKKKKKQNSDTDSGSVQELRLNTAAFVAPTFHTEPRSD